MMNISLLLISFAVIVTFFELSINSSVVFVQGFVIDGTTRTAPSAATGRASWLPCADPIRRRTSSAVSSSSSSNDATTKVAKDNSIKQNLTPEQLDFSLGYLNKHHTDWLVLLAQTFSDLGADMAKANAWSGGSYSIPHASITDLNTQSMQLQVTVRKRNTEETVQTVDIPLNAMPIAAKARQVKALPLVPDDVDRLPMDDVVRRLARLCWMVGQPELSGKLFQLAIQLNGGKKGIGKLPDNLYLNQVPHNRYVRQYFYDAAAQAVLDAVVACSRHAPGISNRMQVISNFPETNPSMDTYRIGTILELVRAVAIKLVEEENLRVRVCVQGSMGVGIFTGVPKQLSGVSKIVQMMDWQSEPGQVNEGIVGNYIRFGAVGADHVVNEIKSVDETTGEETITQHQDDVFLLIAPQSMVGSDSSIYPLLSAMVDAAGDRPVILFNPDLVDKISAAGQQSVRGRQARIDFATSFQTIFHFANVYISGTSYFPILGAISKLHIREPWLAHQRRDFANNAGEIYVPVLASETMPQGDAILAAFET